MVHDSHGVELRLLRALRETTGRFYLKLTGLLSRYLKQLILRSVLLSFRAAGKLLYDRRLGRSPHFRVIYLQLYKRVHIDSLRWASSQQALLVLRSYSLVQV